MQTEAKAVTSMETLTHLDANIRPSGCVLQNASPTRGASSHNDSFRIPCIVWSLSEERAQGGVLKALCVCRFAEASSCSKLAEASACMTYARLRTHSGIETVRCLKHTCSLQSENKVPRSDGRKPVSPSGASYLLHKSNKKHSQGSRCTQDLKLRLAGSSVCIP